MPPTEAPPNTASLTRQASTGPESSEPLAPSDANGTLQPSTAPEPNEPLLPSDASSISQPATAPESTEPLATEASSIPQPATAPDPAHWLDVALHQPLPPEPADGVLDLLAPLLDGPLLTVDRPAPPTVVELVALHRVEVEADYVEPPVIGAGEEPAIPARFAAGLSVLPHIDFPT